MAGPDIRARISADFLGSLRCAGNDIQHQNLTALYSGPYASAGGHSITPENFEHAMVVHAVRRLPRAEWHNDRDQFMQPTHELTDEFITDCTVWNLFHNRNHTVAMKNVDYAHTFWEIPNHLFPLRLAMLHGWPIGDSDVALQVSTTTDRFVANWLAARSVSPLAQALLSAGIAVYRRYFASFDPLRTGKFRTETWDVGWWQIRSALKDRDLGGVELAVVKRAQDSLRARLRPQLSELGFLAPAEVFAVNERQWRCGGHPGPVGVEETPID